MAVVGWKAMGGGDKQVFQSHECYSLILCIFQLRTITQKEDIKKAEQTLQYQKQRHRDVTSGEDKTASVKPGHRNSSDKEWVLMFSFQGGKR